MFGKLGCGRGQMVLWFHGWGYKQLQTASHIHIICIQSVLAPWYSVDGHMGAQLHCYTCVGGGECLKNCIPHPYHMYTKCFSTLICCGLTYGCTLTLLYLYRWGWIVGKLGCGWERMVLWFHGWGSKQLQTASYIHIICIQTVFTPWYAADGHMGALLHCYTCVVGVNFW